MGRRFILTIMLCAFMLAGCGGSGGSSNSSGGDDEQFTVTATAGNGGAITPASSNVNEGETATLTVTSENGFTIDTVTGCGGSLSGNTYTTGAMTADCTVNATFSEVVISTFTVTATAGNGGAITPASSTVNEGETATLTVTPENGFAVDTVTGCSGSLSGSTYTTGAVTSDCTVNATFSEVVATTFTVTATAGNGGSITPTSSTVNEGETATLTVTPESGFAIDAVTGCSGSLSGSTYTTGVVSADCAVTASFANVPNTPLVAFRLSESVLGTGIYGLMAVQVDGQNLVTLNDTLPTGGEVESFAWSPNGARIAYLADQNTDEVDELFSVLLDGTGRVTLNAALVSGGDVIDYQWSPDGSQIAYRASQEQADAIELYVVDADGQNRVKVSTSLVSGGNVESFAWSQDGTRILYSADAATNDQFEVFVNANDGTAHQQVNVSLSAGDEVEAFQWSPLGGFISYVVNASSADDALYVFNPLTSSNTQLDNTITAFINEAGYVWSDNDAFLAVAQDARPSAGENGEVYILAADGSGVSTATLDIRQLTEHLSFISGSTTLLVMSDSNTLAGDSVIYRFSDSGAQIDRDELTGTAGTAEAPNKALFSPDNQQVALHGAQDSWFYDLSGGTATRFVDGSNGGDIIQYLGWSQDSTRFFYAGIASNPTILSPNGSGINELDRATLQNETLRWVNNRLVYTTLTGGVTTSGTSTVESVDQFGGDRLILGELPQTTGSQNIESYVVSSDNSFIVYDAQSTMFNNSGEALYSVNVDGTNNVLLSESLPSGTGIEDYAIQPLN